MSVELQLEFAWANVVEEWRSIPGFSAYEASDFARIRRVSPGRYRFGRGSPGSVLSPVIGSHGYLVVSVAGDNGRRNAQPIHRLVALAFHGVPIPPRDHVAHGTGGKLDNRPGNLRWATRAENMADTLRDGTRAVGVRHGNAKLTPEAASSIREQYRAGGVRHRDLAEQFGVSRPLICLVLQGRSWAA